MPQAQVFRLPVARGEGRFRHRAAVTCRASWAYSSSRCARQKVSVSATMALKVACMGLGTRSDLLLVAILTSSDGGRETVCWVLLIRSIAHSVRVCRRAVAP